MIKLEKSNEAIRKVIKAVENERRPCKLIIYSSGYAVSALDKQILLCDSNDLHEVLFNIELKARTLTEEYENLNVFSIYNYSRKNFEAFEDLRNAR